MTPIYRIAELRELERNAQSALPAGALMQRAGERAARLILEIAAERAGPVLLLAGWGNNGGDALVAATRLRERGIDVRVALLADAGRFAGEARAAWDGWCSAGGAAERDLGALAGAALVVDGLFGIGLNRPLPDNARLWVERVNSWRKAQQRPVLALDIPSGLSAESGALQGAAISASHTLSFLGAKPGLYTGHAPDYVGEVMIDTLGVAAGPASGMLNGPEVFATALAPRARASHKGDFGSLGVLAGARGMTGAGLLCARTALYAGAGRTYLHMPDGDLRVDALHPEVMLRDSLGGLALDAVCAGPGLGQSPAALAALEALLAGTTPCVLDADGLNAIAANAALRALWSARASSKIITPHPLEAARLLRGTASEVEADRIGAALQLTRTFNSVVLLKGAGTVIARADGRFAINPSGNPGLASGGTGDALTGLLGALLAQGLDAWHAALAGAWLHGAAADHLVAAGVGPIGLSASELGPAIRSTVNALVAASR